jgi:hypothetical protein
MNPLLYQLSYAAVGNEDTNHSSVDKIAASRKSDEGKTKIPLAV